MNTKTIRPFRRLAGFTPVRAAVFVLALGLLLPAKVQATTYTFTNTVAGTDPWTTTGNWDANGVPVSDNAAGVTFFSDTTTALGQPTYTISSDPATLTLNTLTLNGKGAAATGNTAVNIGTAGNAWTFDGTTPTINLSGVNGTKTLTYTINPKLALNADLTITGNGTATFNLSGVISGTSRAITKSGTSTVVLKGANTYSGTTTVSAGVLNLGNINAISNSPSVSIASSGATLALSAAGTVVIIPSTLSLTGTGSSTFTGPLHFGGSSTLTNALTLTGSGTTISSFGASVVATLGGAIGGTGPLTMLARGGGGTVQTAVWTLGAASTYTDNTIMKNADGLLDATFKLGVANALPVATSLNLLGIVNNATNNFVTFDLNGNPQTLAGLTDTNSSQGNVGGTFGGRVINSGTPATLTINNSGADTYGTTGTRLLPGTLGGTTAALVAANNLALVKTGAGTLTLAGTNTYNGSTTISNGLINLGVAETVGTGGPLGNPTTLANSIILQGGGLQFSANNTYDYTTSGRLQLADGSTGIIDDGGQTVTFANTIGVGAAKTGALTKQGAGTLNLSAANTYTGGTTISAGTLALGSSGTLGATSGALTMSGGTLDLGGQTSPQVGAVSLTRASIITNGTLTASSCSATLTNGTATVFAILAGSGTALTMNGLGGTLALNNANTYTGLTTIGAGTVSVSAINDYGVAGGLGQNSSANVTQLGAGTNAGTLAYTGGGESNNRTFQIGDGTAAATGGGVINNNGSGALIFDAATFNPTISGITANRTLTLGGTYAGTASEIQGTIQDNNGSTGKLGLIVNGSSWKLSGNNTLSGQAGATGLGIEIKTGGTLTIAGGSTTVNTYGMGTYSPDSGTFNQTGGTVSLAGDLIVGWNSSPTFTLSGGSLTAANIRHQDAGSGSVTISGTATVTAGTVYEGAGGSGTDSLTVNLSTGGTLVANRLYANATASQGSHSLNVNFNGGMLKLNNITGGNLIDLPSGVNSNYASVNVTVKAGGATIDTGSLNTTVRSALVHDSGLGATPDGGLTKLGSGTLTITNANTYTGNTTISAGDLQWVVGGSASNSTVILNASTATNGVSVTDNTRSWTCAAFTAAAAGVLQFNFGVTPGTSVAPLVVTGAADFTAATPTVSIVGTPPPGVGTYPLMTWGSSAGTVPSAVTVTTAFGQTASLSNSATTLYLVVAPVPVTSFPVAAAAPTNLLANGNFGQVANEVVLSNSVSFNINGTFGDYPAFWGSTADLVGWSPYYSDPYGLTTNATPFTDDPSKVLNTTYYLDTVIDTTKHAISLNSADYYLNGLLATNTLNGVTIKAGATYLFTISAGASLGNNETNSIFTAALTEGSGMNATNPATAVPGSLLQMPALSLPLSSGGTAHTTYTNTISGADLAAAQGSGPVNIIFNQINTNGIAGYPTNCLPQVASQVAQVKVYGVGLAVVVPQNDLNHDGVVDQADVNLAQSYLDGSVDGGASATNRENLLINSYGFTTNQALAYLNLTAFDINGDGYFDAADVAALQALVGPSGPTLSSVSPNPVMGSSYPVTLTLTGSGFTGATAVLLTNLTTSSGASHAPTVGSDTSISVSFVPGTTASSWNATVVNGGSSGQASFSVTATTPVTINQNALASAGAGKLVLSGSGGGAGNNYAVLSATNLNSPVVWTPIATNTFDGSGNFSYTNPVVKGTPALFLRISQ